MASDVGSRHDVAMGTIGERIGAAVRAARRKKGLTQEGLAEKVGLTPESVSRIENGTTASLETFVELARVLELDTGRVLAIKMPGRSVSMDRLRLEAETVADLLTMDDRRVADIAAIAALFARKA